MAETILLVMAHRQNRQLLEARLRDRYQIVAVDGRDGEVAILDGEYDLAIVDGPALDAHMSSVAAIKRTVDPVFLPTLMVTARQEVGYLTRRIWQVIDELILIPIESFELWARIEILLRARRYSLSLQRRYERVFEGVPAGLFRASRDGQLLDVNAAMVSLSGYTEKEALIGKQLTDLFVAGDQADPSDLLTADGQLHDLQLQQTGGRRRWVRSQVAVSRDPADGITCVEGVVEDIDDRVRAHAQLVRTNRNLKLLSEDNRSLVKADDPQELLEKACRIIVETGEYRAAWVGKVDPDDLSTLEMLALFAGGPGIQDEPIGRSEAIQGSGPVATAITTGKTCAVQDVSSDPAVSPWQQIHGIQSCVVIPFKDADRVTGILCIFSTEQQAFDKPEIDILEEMTDDLAYGLTVLETRAKKQQAEAALRESEEKYRSVADDMPGLVCRFLPDGILTFVNRGTYEWFGVTPDQLLGDDMYRYVPKESRESIRDLLGALTPHNAVSTYELQVSDEVWQRWVVRAIFDNDEQIREYQAIGRDISDEKQMEAEKAQLEQQIRQSQKMDALGTLAGGIAHDFNNILAAIIGYSELSLDEVDPDTELGDNIQQIISGGYRARDLVSQILTFTRQSEHEPQPVQVSLVAKEVVKLLRASLPATIDIQEDITSEALVMADPVQIHQIVMNLCTNAGHAMSDTGGRLTINLDETDIESETEIGTYTLTAGRYIRLGIEDTGPGIPQEVRDRIFEPYFTTKSKGEGTGLGLSVVHGIVESIDGGIDVISHSGQGTAFIVYLPVVVTGQDHLEVDVGASLATTAKRIMFIDDEVSVANMAGSMLERLGHYPTIYNNAVEALAAFQNAPEEFDLVITDLTMPEMTGLELAGEITVIRPEVPIVLCSGYTLNIPAGAIEKTSIKMVVSKPFSVNDLARAIRGVTDE